MPPNEDPIDVPDEGSAAEMDRIANALSDVASEVGRASGAFAQPQVVEPYPMGAQTSETIDGWQRRNAGASRLIRLQRHEAMQRLLRAEDGLKRMIDWLGRDWEKPDGG